MLRSLLGGRVITHEPVETIFTQINVIEDEHGVAINGTAEFKRDGKTLAFVSSCDVYRFDKDQHIISIHSYCITQRAVPGNKVAT